MRILVFLSFLLLAGPWANSQELLLVEDVESKAKGWPEEARRLLQELPEKAITPEVVFERALKSSDQMDVIRGQRLLRFADELDPQIALQTRVESEIFFTDSKAQSTGFLGPDRVKQRRGEARLIKALSSGTQVTLGLGQDTGFQQFPQMGGPFSFPNIDYNEARYFFQVRQSLWRDGLGRDTRKLLLAGERLSEAGDLEMLGGTESFLSDLYDLFLSAWSLQAELKSIDQSLLRTQRLLSMTRRKTDLGTAETPDLLQVQGNLNQLEIRRIGVLQQLEKLWIQLIVALKLSPSLQEVRADEVPLQLDDSVGLAQNLCETTSVEGLQNQALVQSLRQEYEAARLQTEALKSHTAPDLSALLSHSNNRVDSSMGAAWDGVTEGSHPGTTVGLQLSIPLSASETTTRYIRSKASMEILKARLSFLESSVESDWRSLCDEFKSQGRSLELLARNLDLERRRQAQESRRFEVGRSNAFMAIQAELDVVQADLNLRRAMVENRRTSWKIRIQAGQVARDLEKLIGEEALSE